MPFAASMDSLFASELAEDALFVPQAGPPFPIRVLRKSPDEIIGTGQAQFNTETTILEARVSELAAPREGDTIEMGAGGPLAEGFAIQAPPARNDPQRLIWTLNVRPR